MNADDMELYELESNRQYECVFKCVESEGEVGVGLCTS
jgi:hypothetical protein